MTTKISQINRPVLAMLRADILTALKPIMAEYGLDVDINGGSFDDENYKPKLVITVAGGAEKAGRKDWEAYCVLYQLPKDACGKVITLSGKQYQLTGIKARASKLPITGRELATGKSFKFSVETVRRGLGLKQDFRHAEVRA